MTEAIVFDDVTLWRRTQEELSYDLKSTIFRLVEHRGSRTVPRRKTIDAASLRIHAGEKIGLIGPNGSGKSTLLKLAAGVLQPTFGNVFTRGRVAALIELGAGFDADLSVVDNIVYYGILLGFARAEITRRVPAVLSYAELDAYATSPLKSLSSGMTARLSFAVATEVRPDILLVDEVLSVGDESFRRKSAERMQRFWDERSTIVVVSHDLPFIANNCERALWLDSGRIIRDGPAAEIVDEYLRDVSRHEPAQLLHDVDVSYERAIGHIDSIEVHKRSLRVRGWAATSSTEAGHSVALFVDGQHSKDVTYALPRPDVREARGLPEAVGFAGDIDISHLPFGDYRIDCALLDSPGGRYHLIGNSTNIRLNISGSRLVDVTLAPSADGRRDYHDS